MLQIFADWTIFYDLQLIGLSSGEKCMGYKFSSKKHFFWILMAWKHVNQMKAYCIKFWSNSVFPVDSCNGCINK